MLPVTPSRLVGSLSNSCKKIPGKALCLLKGEVVVGEEEQPHW